MGGKAPGDHDGGGGQAGRAIRAERAHAFSGDFSVDGDGAAACIVMHDIGAAVGGSVAADTGKGLAIVVYGCKCALTIQARG